MLIAPTRTSTTAIRTAGAATSPCIFRATDPVVHLHGQRRAFSEEALDTIEQQGRLVSPSTLSNRIERHGLRAGLTGASPASATGACPFRVFHLRGLRRDRHERCRRFDAVIKLFSREGLRRLVHQGRSRVLSRRCLRPAPSAAVTHLKPGKDILDVWWDSGVCLEGRA